MTRHYLDHASTSPVRPEAVDAMGVDAHRPLRLSVDWNSTVANVDAATNALPSILQGLRALRDPRDDRR